MNLIFGMSLQEHQIHMLVNNIKVELFPITMVLDGSTPQDDFKYLTGAFESYDQIRESNGEGRSLTRSKLKTKVNNDVSID